MSFDQMISLGLLISQIDKKEIRRGVIAPPEMVLLQQLPDGADVLKPVPDRIRELRDEIFTNTSALAPSVPVADPIEAAKQETARLAVQNGSGIEGLGAQTSDFLKTPGVNGLQGGKGAPPAHHVHP